MTALKFTTQRPISSSFRVQKSPESVEVAFNIPPYKLWALGQAGLQKALALEAGPVCNAMPMPNPRPK